LVYCPCMATIKHSRKKQPKKRANKDNVELSQSVDSSSYAPGHCENCTMVMLDARTEEAVRYLAKIFEMNELRVVQNAVKLYFSEMSMVPEIQRTYNGLYSDCCNGDG